MHTAMEVGWVEPRTWGWPKKSKSKKRESLPSPWSSPGSTQQRDPGGAGVTSSLPCSQEDPSALHHSGSWPQRLGAPGLAHLVSSSPHSHGHTGRTQRGRTVSVTEQNICPPHRHRTEASSVTVACLLCMCPAV